MGLLKKKEKEFKKKVIAEAAHELFSDKPYESVTVDDVARLAGCGKGTLYLYFKSKDHILTHLITESLKRLCADIEKQCINNTDIISALNNYLSLQFHFFLDYSRIFSSWMRRRSDSSFDVELKEEVQKILDQKVQMIAGILERGVQEKSVIEVNSLELARLLDSIIMDSAGIIVKHESGDYDPEKVLDLMKFVLSNGVILKSSSG